MKRKISAILLCMMIFLFASAESCETSSRRENIDDTLTVTNKLTDSQKTPTDIDYSLERYNLIKRAYWVNGQRQKADSVPCAVDRPIGYVVLFSDSGAILGSYTVDGKVSSLNSYLSPDSEYYQRDSNRVEWLADVDGSYGVNTDGIFWFTVDGHYMEWTGDYLYSDIPFEVTDPVLVVKEV